MNIPFCLIDEFKANNDIRTLATIIYLKSKFSNGCFYGKTVRELAGKLKVSKSCAAKYLKICRRYLKTHNGNTSIMSFKAICRGFGLDRVKGLSVNKVGSVKEIENEIYYLILKNKSNQFDYIKKKSSDLQNPKGAYAHLLLKSAKRFMRSRTPIGEMTKYSVSFKKIALHLGTSVGTAYNFVMKLVKSDKLIKISSFNSNGKIIRCMIELFSGKDGDFISRCLNQIKVKPNEYVFL